MCDHAGFDDEALTVKQAGKILNRHENCIREYERKGKLKAVRDYRGYRIFRLQDVLKLKAEMESVTP